MKCKWEEDNRRTVFELSLHNIVKKENMTTEYYEFYYWTTLLLVCLEYA